MKLLVFTQKYADKIIIPQNIQNKFDVKYIPFDSNNIDNLLDIALFRVINFPTFIIIDDKGKLLLRIRGSISEEYLERYLTGDINEC